MCEYKPTELPSSNARVNVASNSIVNRRSVPGVITARPSESTPGSSGSSIEPLTRKSQRKERKGQKKKTIQIQQSHAMIGGDVRAEKSLDLRFQYRRFIAGYPGKSWSSRMLESLATTTGSGVQYLRGVVA